MALFIIPGVALSQKLNRPSIDKFTNDTTYSTTQEKIASTEKFSSAVGNVLNASILKLHGKVFLSVEIDATFADNQFFTIAAGDTTSLKLADNTLVTLVCGENIPATGQIIKKGLIERKYWTARINYFIRKADVEKLLASPVTAIRIGIRDGHFDFDVTSKNSDVLKKMFLLITQAK